MLTFMIYIQICSAAILSDWSQTGERCISCLFIHFLGITVQVCIIVYTKLCLWHKSAMLALSHLQQQDQLIGRPDSPILASVQDARRYLQVSLRFTK